MKKLILLMLVFVLAASLVFAAGDNSDGNSNDDHGDDSTDDSADDNSSELEVEDEPESEVGDSSKSEVEVERELSDKGEFKLKLKFHNEEVESEFEFEEKREGNETKIQAKLSNGRNAEIKIMPSTASETALARLRLKVCNESNNCTIQLKEVNVGNETRAAYEIQIERHSRILGIFSAKMHIETEVDAENGEVIGEHKPWWAFIATEPAE